MHGPVPLSLHSNLVFFFSLFPQHLRSNFMEFGQNQLNTWACDELFYYGEKEKGLIRFPLLIIYS